MLALRLDILQNKLPINAKEKISSTLCLAIISAYAQQVALPSNSCIKVQGRAIRNYNNRHMVSTKDATVPKLFKRVIGSASVQNWDFIRTEMDNIKGGQAFHSRDS